jgi:hypothetical protein
VLNPTSNAWIQCVLEHERATQTITVADVSDASVKSSFALPGTTLVRLDDAYGVRLEHAQLGGALSLRCRDAAHYAKYTDVFVAAGVQRAGSTREQKRSVAAHGFIVKKEKSEAKKRRVFAVLRDSQLDCFESEVAPQHAALAAPRSFDLWGAVVTMTPESHKRVFAVYPDGEQQPFLLQCKDAADFKLWFGKISEATGSAGDDDSNTTQVFGASLASVMNRQGRRPPIPLAMAATVDYLETNGFRSPRLFFQTPSAASQARCERFIEQFNTGADAQLAQCDDPVAVALLFRSFLEQLPEPLLTFERHQAFMGCFKEAGGGPDEAKVLDEVAALPEDNFVLIKFVCRFFYDCAQQDKKTSVRDLAELFGPIFCRPQDKRSTLRQEMVVPLAEMLIHIQRNAPTNIIYKLKDDRKKLCIALYAYKGRTDRELSFDAGTVITVLKKDKSGWWKGGIMRVQSQTRLERSAPAAAAAAPASSPLGANKMMVVGWFPHDFVEEYVPGRQTEQLIAGGLNLQEAAVRSGAVDADKALAALKKLQAQGDDCSSTSNDSSSTQMATHVTVMPAQRLAAEAAAVAIMTPQADTVVVAAGQDIADPPAAQPLLSPKNVGLIEDAPSSLVSALADAPAPSASLSSPEATPTNADAQLNTAKTRGLRTIKILFERKLITADERKAVSRKCLALDDNTLAVLESTADDLEDCAAQLRDLVL